MDPQVELEGKLLEAAHIGDGDTILKLIENGVSVNSTNKINGWTPLHWAAHRGHENIVTHLLDNGADPNVVNQKGETPAQLASKDKLRALLGGDPNCDAASSSGDLHFTPNYLANPAFPYQSLPQLEPQVKELPVNSSMNSSLDHHQMPSPASISSRTDSSAMMHTEENEMVLKVRVANAAERDYIEIELNRSNLTFEALVSTMCRELQVNKQLIHKIRKLPDTILRKDKDVKRLRDFQELEMVLSNKAVTDNSRGSGPSVSPKHIDVVY